VRLGLTPTCEYEPPALIELGTVHELTLTGNWRDICLFGKEFGGSDGWTFMGISVPVSNCSA
jgi:hypothetical protein